MKREQITIACGQQREPIEAEVYGAFAIHPPLYAGQGYWSKRTAVFVVTHIATGYAVCDQAKPKARRIAQELNTALPAADFTAKDLEKKPASYREFVKKARAIIEELS